MKKLRMVYNLIKAYPIIYNLILIIIIFNPKLSFWTYDITGASIYTMILCFIASYPFKLCNWYRSLCVSSMEALLLEWIDVNIININNYIRILQAVVIGGIILSIILYAHGVRNKKSNNKSLEKAD